MRYQFTEYLNNTFYIPINMMDGMLLHAQKITFSWICNYNFTRSSKVILKENNYFIHLV
jgi:hypothetical protein